MDPHPITVGLTLANEIIVDRNTQKPSIIGAFIGLAVDEFPSNPQRFSVFSVLTHGTGSGTIELRAFSVRTNQQIYSQRGTIYFPEISDVVNATFRVKSITFPHPGYYVFRLFIDDVPVPQATCRLRVYESEENE